MANLLRQNPLAFALATIAALLTVVIAVEAAFNFWSTPPAPVAKAPAPSEVKMLPPLAAVVPDQAYPETAARPLFTPTRRPAPAALQVASTMVKGQFILTGVLAVRDQKIALLKEKASGKFHRVESGKDLNGMTLTAIDNDKVKLSQGGDEEVLSLQVQKGPAPAAGPAGAPGTAAGTVQGPFAPVGQPAQAQAPGTPPPAQPPVATPPGGFPMAPGGPMGPVPSQPAVTAQPGANPAQRSGAGPSVNQPGTTQSDTGTTPMTPEELLARRRARRGQPNQ